MTVTFQTLGLSQPVLQALALKDYTQPSPIQAQAIPSLLQGRDLLGIAQTGTGKTAAFMLPSIDRLSGARRPQSRTCRMLVLAPTRELASQIAQSARDYAKFTPLNVATVFGGTSLHKNRQDLARGVDVLVATPGRLLDLIDQGALTLSKLEILVLDEADQMMDLGFIHALRRIVAMLPRERQTLFFSATMPKAIRELAGKYLTDPIEVKVAPEATTAERVTQFVTFCNQGEKQALLTLTLKATTIDRALVFTRTKHGADRVVRQLAASGIAANAIHGNKSQPQRERALGEFRAGKVPILVATDIAARGIDVSGVSHVFNFELPNVPDQYVHRIGRTARAGNDGVAIAFCSDEERGDLRGIEKLIRQRIEVMPPPAGLAAEAARIKALRPAPAPAGERQERHERPRHEQRRPGGPSRRKPGGSGPNHRTSNGGVRKGEVGRHSGRVRRSSDARI
ncbi:MAG: DEAD/DEAH box helicase [Allosphingosinicella sp.]|uniref:DEAD/DEAH box helicase n=1 Tax=Allosphingosinicella sp. TaxID=2823234 RepID=UPI0039281A64